jgi:hypothetical protein
MERLKELKLYDEEITLILSALINDRAGTWGDGRGDRINALVRRIKLVTRDRG